MVTDDPLLVRWGLHDLVEGFPTYVHHSDTPCTEFVEPAQSRTVLDYISLENDEAIARTLQEDETSARLHDWGESSHAPYTDFWETNAAPGHDYDSGPDSDSGGVPEISEDSATFDGELGRRLSQMDSIPHVPRINGDIPTVDDASAAHQRLLDRLRLYGLSELKVDGDGNCQFRAFSDQLYRTPIHHKSVRNDIVNQLTSNPEFYEGYVPMKYADYVKKMSRSGEWGDHVTLQAAADYYGVRICLLTSFKDTSFIQILPRKTKSKRVIFLSFWAEVHYNSVYPEGDVPPYYEQKKKSGPWNFVKKTLKI